MDDCPIPRVLPDNATEFQKLRLMHERQTYILCKIQSAQKVMEALATEIAKDSVEAGRLTRDSVRKFKDIEVAYILDSRHAIRVQGEKISLQDILKET